MEYSLDVLSNINLLENQLGAASTNVFYQSIDTVLKRCLNVSVIDIDNLLLLKLRKQRLDTNMSEYPCSTSTYYASNNNYHSVTRIFYNKTEASTHLQNCLAELTKRGYTVISGVVTNIGIKYVVSYTVYM